MPGSTRYPGWASSSCRCSSSPAAGTALTTPRIAHLTWQALAPGRARFAVLERSAHRPWAEEPQAYFALLDEFLVGCGC